jgi:hypothetical protein
MLTRFICAAAAFFLTAYSPEALAQGKVAILMPGAGGAVPNDFLVRNQSRIGGKGVSVVVTTSSSEAASISREASAKGSKVVLVAMSRGAVDAANALAAGAKLNGLVIVSGVLREARQTLGSPGLLPRTLLVHNKHDACNLTLPEFASEFASWSGGRATVRWVNVSGPAVPRECGPLGAHGFHRQDGGAVAAINGFIASR